MPQVFSNGSSNWSSSNPSTSARNSGAATARVTMKAVHRRSDRPPAFARTWKTVKKPMIVVTSMR